MDRLVERAIRASLGNWRPVDRGEDPNTVDVLHHNRLVEDALKLSIPTTLPGKPSGVSLVEQVDHIFIAGKCVRDLPADDLIGGVRHLLEVQHQSAMISFGPPASYIAVLYTWHGCILMAKLLRPNAVGADRRLIDISMASRQSGYVGLQKIWEDEQSRGNPWVHFGVALARRFEQQRKESDFRRMVIEDWVPRDSPYWA